MRHFCLSCQAFGADHRHGYHAECAIRLFGTETPPTVGFSTPDVLNEAQKMVGKMSVSGVQPKLSVSHDRKTCQLIVAQKGGEYIFVAFIFFVLSWLNNSCASVREKFVQIRGGRSATN
jgi:hypothetical protein